MTGRIITFYSYKGGTGRTMALANIACLLANQKKRKSKTKQNKVLMIDCDLEAPGLPAYFGRYLPTRWQDKTGWIDLVERLYLKLPSNATKEKPQTTTDAEKLIASIDVSSYAIESNLPGISLISAGMQNRKYNNRVNTFDWQGLFYRSPYLFKALAESLSEKYEYVLIDSRTGETDIAGICTAILPDTLITVFTPNFQSTDGLQNTIRNAISYRSESADLRPLVIVPLPSRIDSTDSQRRHLWRFGGEVNGIEYSGYQAFFESVLVSAYEFEKLDLTNFFETIQIDYSAEYSFGEDIAALSESSSDVFSQRARFEALLDEILYFQVPGEKVLKGKYASKIYGGNDVYDVFIAYSREDRHVAMQLLVLFESKGLTVFFDTSIYAGSHFSVEMERALDESSTVVVLWSEKSKHSRYVLDEANEGLERGVLFPALIEDTRIPYGFRGIQTADLSDWDGDPSHPECKNLLDAIARRLNAQR